MTVLPAAQLAAVHRVRLAVARLLPGRLEHAWAARRVRSWARRMSRAGAVVIDTETTDMNGAICEIAVVDAAGNVLLDTLVNPGCPIDPAATAVHGITDVDVAAAPPLAEVLPRLLEVTAGRPVLAYNAPYDRDVLIGDAARLGLHLGRLANPATWGCLMRARAVAAGCAWIRLEAGHRALGDAEAARQVLLELAA